MKEHYDFSNMEGKKNPYAKYLKQPVAMRLNPDVGSLLSFLESCEPLDVDFPEIDDSWPVDDESL